MMLELRLGLKDDGLQGLNLVIGFEGWFRVLRNLRLPFSPLSPLAVAEHSTAQSRSLTPEQSLSVSPFFTTTDLYFLAHLAPLQDQAYTLSGLLGRTMQRPMGVKQAEGE